MTDHPGSKSNQRRFPRIYLQSSERSQAPILGARLTLANGQKLDVFDLSYIGVAGIRPPNLEIALGDKVDAKLELSSEPKPVEFAATVARANERMIALHFAQLSTPARRALDKFLQAKIVGLHMRPIDAKLFAKNATFTHWFHGPNNADVFLWYAELRLEQAVVELGGDFLKWKKGRFFTGVARQFLDDENDDYLKPLLDGDFEAETGASADKGLTPLMARVLDMLSQIEDPQKVLQPLVDALLARQKGA